jgi:hypothetical protein
VSDGKGGGLGLSDLGVRNLVVRLLRGAVVHDLGRNGGGGSGCLWVGGLLMITCELGCPFWIVRNLYVLVSFHYS